MTGIRIFLLAGGLKALDEILPGYSKDLSGAGAVSVRLWQDIHFERVDVGVLPKRDFGTSISWHRGHCSNSSCAVKC